MHAQISHPSADLLMAFDLGKLDDDAAQGVSEHLEGCPQCRQQVESQSADDFLARLRLAHGLGTTLPPATAMLETALDLPHEAAQPQSAMPIADLAPELANHPHYQILRELGRGGMGVVYLAQNRLMNRHEVLKVLNPRMLLQAGGTERFLREIQSAAQLHHPNVVAAYSVLPLGELLVFAMEYIPGEDLAKVVAARGRLPVATACYYAQQALLGLQHAFEKKMVHRDIKPQNLILCREGNKHRIKILDFGLAKVIHEDTQSAGLTSTGQAMGTPEFMAPEQCLDAASADIRADIYSLGCTLYFLLTGTAPFQGRSTYEIYQAHQMREAKPLNRGRPEIPVQLAAVVRKMMAKNPAHRYQTPAQVAEALAPFIKPIAGKAPAKRAQAPSIGKTLGVDGAQAAGKSKHPIQFQPPRRGALLTAFRRRPLTAAVLGLGLLMVGYFLVATIVRIATDKGQIIVEVDAPGVEITVKENGAIIQDHPGQREIALSAGEHALLIELKDPNGDTSFVTRSLTVKRGTKEIIHVQYQLANAKTDESKVDQSPQTHKAEQPILNAPLPAARVIAAERSLVAPAPAIGQQRLGTNNSAVTNAIITNSIGMKLAYIKPGTFMMGSPKDEQSRQNNEEQHKVEITRPFYMGVYDVTQAQYENLMGTNPSRYTRAQGGGPDHPVDQVTWDEAVEFCKKLSELAQEKEAGRVYRLPTEAEWEYACRAGTQTAFHYGNSLSSRQANFNGQQPYGGAERGPWIMKTSPVGSYEPNAWGLYDMHGNVWQWCADWYDENYYKISPKDDPPGPSSGSLIAVFAGPARVVRGGSWRWPGGPYARSAERGAVPPTRRCWHHPSWLKYGDVPPDGGDLGFRVVMVPSTAPDLAQTPTREVPVAKPPVQQEAPLAGRPLAPHQEPLTLDLGDGLKMEFVRIPAGEFMMGKPDSEQQAREDEKSTAPRGWRTQEERKERPSHRVAISKDFYIAKYPVTQEQHRKLMGRNPSYFSATGGGKAKVEGMDTDRFPVETVSWHEAQEFCRKLSEVAGRPCTLPTEAQWEYACRGGTTTPFYFGTSCNGTQVNCKGSYPFGTAEKGPYLERTCQVGSYPANPFGLYDMCGNVCQWCQDYCDAQPYDVSVSVDPQGPAYGPMRVERGGGWDHECWGCRSAYRAGNGAANRYNNTGFRVVFAPGVNGASLRRSPAPDMPSPAPLDTGAPAEAKRPYDTLELGNGVKMEFARIPAGEFTMGASDSDSAPHADCEKPQHKVKISKPFYMAIYPVTQEQYTKVMGFNPAEFSATGRGARQVQGMDTNRFPVENASWDDAQEFCRRLSQRTGRSCTLPTEAQWEYACRAGTTTPFYFGTWANGTQGNCNGNFPVGTKEKGPYLGRTCPVGSYPPNPWGLYDMEGNVQQWCADYWGERYYSVSQTLDPTGPADGATPVFRQSTGTWHKDCRVLRGARWQEGPSGSSARTCWMPFVRNLNMGFRVVCPE